MSNPVSRGNRRSFADVRTAEMDPRAGAASLGRLAVSMVDPKLAAVARLDLKR